MKTSKRHHMHVQRHDISHMLNVNKRIYYYLWGNARVTALASTMRMRIRTLMASRAYMSEHQVMYEIVMH